MKREEDLEVGEKIELEVEKGELASRYVSKVEEVIDSNTFVIERPTSSEDVGYLSVGQIIKVLYYRQSGLYYFDAEVIERIKADDIVTTKINVLSDRYKVQRRNYFRLNTLIEVSVSIIDGSKGRPEKTAMGKFDTIDISGGGMRILTPFPMEAGMELEVTPKINTIQGHVIRARVVRSESSLKSADGFETAIEFVDVQPNVRQAIIQFVFAKQREILKKGYK